MTAAKYCRLSEVEHGSTELTEGRLVFLLGMHYSQHGVIALNITASRARASSGESVNTSSASMPVSGSPTRPAILADSAQRAAGRPPIGLAQQRRLS